MMRKLSTPSKVERKQALSMEQFRHLRPDLLPAWILYSLLPSDLLSHIVLRLVAMSCSSVSTGPHYTTPKLKIVLTVSRHEAMFTFESSCYEEPLTSPSEKS